MKPFCVQIDSSQNKLTNLWHFQFLNSLSVAMLATVHWPVLWNLLNMSSSILDDHGVNRFRRSRLECDGKQCPVLTCYFFHNQLFVSRNIVLTAGTCTSTCISEQKFDVWGLYSPWAKVNKERKKEQCNCLWATHIIFKANTRTWLRENITSNRNEEYMKIIFVSPCSIGWRNLLVFDPKHFLSDLLANI